MDKIIKYIENEMLKRKLTEDELAIADICYIQGKQDKFNEIINNSNEYSNIYYFNI